MAFRGNQVELTRFAMPERTQDSHHLPGHSAVENVCDVNGRL